MVNRIFYQEEFKEFRKILIYKREDIELCIHLCQLEHNPLFDRSINSFIKENEDRIYYLKGFYNEVNKLFKLDSSSITKLVDNIIYDYYYNNKFIVMLQHLYAEEVELFTNKYIEINKMSKEERKSFITLMKLSK